MQMNYKEQLQQEIAQAQLQLQELEKLEQAKMKQRNLINNQLLKIAMKKQEAQATIINNRELLRMTMTFK
jgi:hypothetical protein